MIVIAIISILAMIAVPAYNDSITKTRRTDGQTALMDVMSRQERFFTQNNTYTTNLAALPASAASKEGFYTISAAACGGGITSCVILTATAQGGQVSDGNLTLDSRGQKLPADKW
jgi:type IV pilus assembly protein PilE